MHRFCLVGSLLWLGLVLPSAALAVGTGLTAEYYDNSDFTTLKFTRIDPVVDFNWGAAAPTNTMGVDTFSARWSGQVEARYSETYTFHVTADDGARLWVNDRLVVARTKYSVPGLEMTGRIELESGQRYNLTLECIENTGNAQVSLTWSSTSQVRQVIPQSQLYPSLGSRDAGSILVERWLNIAGTNLSALTGSANYPNKPDGREFLTTFECLQTNWADNYATRASGYILAPTNGTYAFAVSGDDMVQLFLSTDAAAANKRLIASNAAPTGFRQFTNSAGQISASVSLTAWQKYYVELLHKEGTGADHFSVAWKTPGATNFTVIPASGLVPAGLDRSAPAQAGYLDTLVPSHPRLLASAERFEWLKRTLAANSIPQLNTWWGSISNSAASILNQPVNIYNSAGILDESRSVMDRVYKCAMTYRMTGNTNFAERAWAELQQVASTNFPDWNPSHFLDTAEMTHACAIGYDWLYDYWTQARRDTIRTAIVNKGLNQSLNLYALNSDWVASDANNWNLVCNGGMIMGALAVGTESESTAEYILSKAVPSAAAVMKHYATDNGGWYEGPMYWNYTTSYNMRLMGSLESALGSDFGLSKTPGLPETGMMSLYMVGPGSRVAFNFADSSAYNLRGPHLFWLSRRFNRPEFSWYSRTNSGVETLDLLWYDPRGDDPQIAGLQPDNYFRGPTGTTAYSPAEIVTLRSGWQDRDATFVGFKAGELGASHGHLDAGNFVLEALGVRWAYDIGGDDYSLSGYFSKPQRWTYYRLRAEGHNALVINPSSSADQVSGAKLPVTLYTSEPNSERSATVMDLTGAYGITKVWRGIQLFKNRRWVLIQDELQAASPANVWWFMHFRSSDTSAEILDNGAAAMLTRDGERLWLSIVSGGGSFAISNAVPLPTSPNPSGQANNDNFHKLAIHLANVTNTTLAVLIVPLAPGENPPTGNLSLLPLVDWAIGMTNNLVVRTNTSIKWNGAVNSGWDLNTVNWKLIAGGTPTTYGDGAPGDVVWFDDTLTANPAITLNRKVSPGGMTFSNTTTVYSLSGSGSIAGSGGLSKTGTNTVTLSTGNTFTGDVGIGDGSLVVRNSAALGTGTKTINVKSAFTVNSTKAELHLNGSGGAITVPATFTINAYCDQNSTSIIVNEAGNNIVESPINVVTGGGHLRVNVVSGSLTLKGNVTNLRSSSNRVLYLSGTGTNTVSGVVQDNPIGTPLMYITTWGGTWILSNTNTYTGQTVVATNSTLVIDGSIANAPTGLIVQSGGTLKGTGTIGAATTVQAGGVLAAGPSLGTLTVNNSLNLAGTVVMEIARNGAVLANDLVTGVNPLITYGGTLIVTNIGSRALQVGDSFQLFSATAYAGAFTNIVYPAGYTFTNKLAVNGTIAVLTTPTPPTLSYAPSGGNWVFNWTGSGYKLQMQTNSLAVGLSTNWVDVPGGNTSGVSVPAPVADYPAAFFRLISTP